jgi:hypothetical protein
LNSLVYVIIACLMFLILIRYITKLSKALLVLGAILFAVLMFLII